VGIGVVDYVTGPDLGFSLFYLVPILWSAWRTGRPAALGMAVLASTCWLTADAGWHGVNGVTIWNGFTRLGIYTSMAWLTSRLRVDQQQLVDLNGKLQDANAKLQDVLKNEQTLARTDALTGLPNRRLFMEELRRATARSHRSGTPIAIAYLDLDHFKLFNDRHGHTAGDAGLRAVGEALRAHVRENDVAARLGGDEFGIVLDRCDEDTARALAARLLHELTRSLAAAPKGAVAVSIGVACFEGPPPSPEDMIDHADAAMYCAKAEGTKGIYVTTIAARGRSTR
jgi:diguanylate cyclase (GGDEF)-like protein